MSELVISDTLIAELERAKGPVDLKTQSGRMLGKYTPEPLIPWEPGVTREEIDRRVRESERTTLAEIWRRLGAQ